MNKDRLNILLKEHFGFDHFRPLQLDIISALLDQQDALAIMPTGGGKSLCFQLTALALPGCCLVISPLIALMKDQVDGLKANGIAAAYLNSSQTAAEQEEILAAVQKDQLKLLYLAPESADLLFRYLSGFTPSFIAIDEAHCISSWGHDFRPSYTQLGRLRMRYPQTPILALTATADKATREDILNQLQIPHARTYLSSFNRPNLSLEVRAGQNRFRQIVEYISAQPGESGIIYCLSRKGTENLAAKLQSEGFTCEAYHAGLPARERSRIQEGFSADSIPIICATIAFGMGIDKSNVRWVIHYNLPKNLEGYYQEIGRAGRDGLPSKTLLFHSYSDVVQLKSFIAEAANAEIQEAKLDRMVQYADALTCRRKILLNYFGEIQTENCGNCDRCLHPPEFFNGTIIAQKALSCIVRLKEQEPLPMVIDVLRGARKAEIIDKQYQEIKTYGAGQEISWQDWQQYLIQLINQGYLELAFHQGNILKTTPLALPVLRGEARVELAHVISEAKTGKKELSAPQSSAKSKIPADSLFERLRQLRLEIAREEDIPAYLVFNDATLKDMERVRPVTDEEFLTVDGVGRRKMENYGYRFISEIIKFRKDKKVLSSKQSTTEHTLELFRNGHSPEEIARKRGLHLSTIQTHLIKLAAEGRDIDLKTLIAESDLRLLQEARTQIVDGKLRDYFEYFEERMDYFTIRAGLLLLEQEV